MSPALPRTIPVIPVLVNLLRARARDGASAADIGQVQRRLLGNLIRHAYHAVPSYRDSAEADLVNKSLRDADPQASVGSLLRHVPVADRDAVRSMEPTHVLADGFTPTSTRAASTSGSSGRPITLYYSERDLGYLRATYLWDLLASGLRPFDRIGYFRVGQFRRHRLEALGLARNVHVNTSLPVDDQVEIFLRGRPSFVYGFPSAIAAVVERLRARDIRPAWVRTVLFAGESTTPAARGEVLDYLGARGHEVYASVEAYTIARTCPRGRMHLRSADVVVEVVGDDGVARLADGADHELTGEILVTRLHAEAMPLLRYRLGDRVHITPNDCPCGVRQTPILRRVSGRTDERVRTRHGLKRSGDFLFSLVLGVDGVRQLQIVHRGDGAADVLIVAARQTAGDLADRVRAALEPATIDFDLHVRLVDSIAAEPNGKVRGVKRL